MESEFNPLIQIINTHIKHNWYGALGNIICDCLPTGFNFIHHPLGPAIQPFFYPVKYMSVQAMNSQFIQANAVGNGAKDLTKV